MLRTLLTIGLVQLVTMFVMLVRTKTLAVTQGPEFVGIMSVIDKLLALISQTLSLSLPFAALRFLPERWNSSPADFRRLYAAMRNVVIGVIVVATAGALAITFRRPEFWGAELLPYHGAVAIAFVGLPVVALVPFLQNAFAGRMQQHRAMGVAFFHAVVLSLSVVGAWWGGLAGYYWMYAATGTILVLLVSRSITSDLPPRARPIVTPGPLGLPPTMWRFSGFLFVLTFLAPYAALYVHYRLLQTQGAEAAGWMQAAFGIGISVRAVLGSAHSVFLTPNVNTGGTPAQRMRWANDFQMLFCLLAGLAVPPLLLFPDLAVRVLYAPSFSPGAAFVLIFVGSEVINLLGGTYQALVVAFDRMRVHTMNNLIAQVCVVATAFWLVPPYGILGAGLSALAGPAYMFIATMAFLHHAYDLRMSRRALARTLWLIGSLLAGGLYGASTRQTPFEAFVPKAGLYLVIVVGFWSLLTDEERAKAYTLASKWRRA